VPELVAQRTVIGSEGERQQLVEALQRCGGNKAEAARLLGIPRSTFFSKLRRHGLG
jgi:transcriptional regulator of acetoin/glycerol metabolism